MRILTAEELREALHYSVITGLFYWREDRPSNNQAPSRVKGTVAGRLNPKGYTVITLLGTPHYAHRLVFLWLFGEFPDETLRVDHESGVKNDNRWLNLRTTSNSENVHYRFKRKVGKYLPGVGKTENTWWASIIVNRKKIYLGSASSEEEAHQLYQEASRKYFGDFSPYRIIPEGVN